MSDKTLAMTSMISRLFREAPPVDEMGPGGHILRTLTSKAEADGAALPSMLECQLVLAGGLQLAGILTTTPENALRLMTPAKRGDNVLVMVDYYFDYSDVLTIAIQREMPQAARFAARGGSSLILPNQ